jgi:hypothetical protein
MVQVKVPMAATFLFTNAETLSESARLDGTAAPNSAAMHNVLPQDRIA